MHPWSDHLHLGCGRTIPKGWVNVDGSWQVLLAKNPLLKQLLMALRIVSPQQAEIPWSSDVLRLNLTRPIPFPDASFQAVFSSHMLEHLYFDDAFRLLRECHRVLRPGGVCRVIVPDLESIVSRYLQAKSAGNVDAATRFMEEMFVHDKRQKHGLAGFYQRVTAFHQHKWMYDAASLEQLFLRAGFGKVRQAVHLDSRIQRIGEVEDAGRILGGEGIAVEGVKE